MDLPEQTLKDIHFVWMNAKTHLNKLKHNPDTKEVDIKHTEGYITGVQEVIHQLGYIPTTEGLVHYPGE